MDSSIINNNFNNNVIGGLNDFIHTINILGVNWYRSNYRINYDDNGEIRTMDKEIIDKVMFDNFLRSAPTMVVDAKDRKTISAYGSIDVNDLRSAIDTFKKVPEYGELLKQVKKQKEVIDKINHILNNQINYREFVDIVNAIEDVVKEVE